MAELSVTEKEALAHALKDAAKFSQDGCFLHRLHCVQLVALGMSTQRVAHFFNDDPSSVARWVRHFKEFGVEGLRDDQKPGRPATLNPEQLRELQQLLERHPAPSGDGGWEWSGKLLATHIEQRYGVTLSVRQCQRLLRQLQGKCVKQEQWSHELAAADKAPLLSPPNRSKSPRS